MQCSRCKIIPGVAGYRDPPWFFRMLVLSMTAFGHNQVPTIFFYHLNNFPDFQDKPSDIRITLIDSVTI